MLCMTKYCINTSTELSSSSVSGIPLLDLIDGGNALFRNIDVLRTEIFQTTELLVPVFTVES